MRQLVLFLCLFLFVFASNSFAGENICFDETTASRMLVTIEKSTNLQEQVDLLKQGNAELERQIGLLKEINVLEREKANIYKDITILQKDTYESMLKESKPNPLKMFFQAIGNIGIGALIGIGLALAL